MNHSIKDLNYSTIDMMKFIASILVICIHTHPLFHIQKDVNYFFVHLITRIAVPFFFISSGFFFYKKINKEGYQIKFLFKYLKRLCFIFGIWFLIYFPFSFIFPYLKLQHHQNQMIQKYLFSIIYIGSFSHLWFFPALILSITLLFFLSQWIKLRILLLLSVALYLFGTLGDTYYQLQTIKTIEIIHTWIRSEFWTSRNGLFFGLPFVTIGAIISCLKINAISKKMIDLGVLFSSLLLLAEFIFIKENQWAIDYNMYIMLMPFSFFFFLYLITSKRVYTNSSMLRDFSLLIYGFHYIPVALIRVLQDYHVIGSVYNHYTFLISLSSSLLFSYVFIRLTTKKPDLSRV